MPWMVLRKPVRSSKSVFEQKLASMLKLSHRERFLLLVALALVAAVVLAVQLVGTPLILNAPRVCFENGACVWVELATTVEQQKKGLMFRESLARDSGMLFWFDAETDHTFWMKNTLVPLDLVWLNARRQIVGLRENVQPCSADPCLLYSIDAPSQFVLETGADFIQKNGVRTGQTVGFANFYPD